MNRIMSLVIGLLLLVMGTAVQGATYGNLELQKAEVVAVHDGDTLTITLPEIPKVFGERIGLRLDGIDAPELNSTCPDLHARFRERQRAVEARDFLKRQIEISHDLVVVNVGRDKYFRLLGRVFADGVDLSELMLASGFAKPYDGGKKEGWCDIPE